MTWVLITVYHLPHLPSDVLSPSGPNEHSPSAPATNWRFPYGAGNASFFFGNLFFLITLHSKAVSASSDISLLFIPLCSISFLRFPAPLSPPLLPPRWDFRIWSEYGWKQNTMSRFIGGASISQVWCYPSSNSWPSFLLVNTSYLGYLQAPHCNREICFSGSLLRNIYRSPTAESFALLHQSNRQHWYPLNHACGHQNFAGSESVEAKMERSGTKE